MGETQKFTEGMMVTIPQNLKYTEETFTTWPTMNEFIGTSQKIKKIRDDGNFIIDDWLWDRRDFEILESPKKTKPIKLEKKQTLTKGMMVTIPDKLKYTKAKYGISEPMKQLIGTSQKIEKLIDNDDLLIKRWLWGKEDFKFLEVVIKPIEVPEIKDSKISEEVMKPHIEASQEIENIPEISEPFKKTKSRKVLLKDLIGS